MSEIRDLTNMKIEELKVFDEDAIEIVSRTPLLNEQEKDMLTSYSESMNCAFSNSQVFRTPTEADISVLNDTKFPTPASKYFQCLREMNVHQSELIGLLFDYEDKQQDIRILIEEIDHMTENLPVNKFSYDYKRASIEIEKKKIQLKREVFNLKQMRRTAEGRMRELDMWDKRIKHFRKIVEDQGISTVDPNHHQLISYTIRFIRQTIHMLTSGSNPSPSEAANLLGQLTTAMNKVREDRLLPLLCRETTPREVQFIAEYGLGGNIDEFIKIANENGHSLRIEDKREEKEPQYLEEGYKV